MPRQGHRDASHPRGETQVGTRAPAGWMGPHLQLGPLSLLGTAESLLKAWCQLLIGVTGLLAGKGNVQPGLGLLEQEEDKWVS